MFVITSKILENKKHVGFEGYWVEQTEKGNIIQSDELHITKEIGMDLATLGLLFCFLPNNLPVFKEAKLGKFSDFGSVSYRDSGFIYYASVSNKCIERFKGNISEHKVGNKIKKVDYKDKESYTLIGDLWFFEDMFGVDLKKNLNNDILYSMKLVTLSHMYVIAQFFKDTLKAEFLDGIDYGDNLFIMKFKLGDDLFTIKSVNRRGIILKAYEVDTPLTSEPITENTSYDIIDKLFNVVKEKLEV